MRLLYPASKQTRGSFSNDPPCLSVLVVEDVRSTADILGMFFKSAGHTVRVAYDGKEAVRQAHVALPDLVLMDLGLPEMSGLDAVREIRQLQGGKRLVAIALSGFDDEEIIDRCADCGFDAHLSKPADPRELEAIVRSMF